MGNMDACNGNFCGGDDVQNDLISRQAAIEALLGITAMRNTIPLDSAIFNIKKLPSAQPELIHCNDCKHRDPEDKKCDSGHSIQWQLPRDDNWFCADAERRTDE